MIFYEMNLNFNTKLFFVIKIDILVENVEFNSQILLNVYKICNTPYE